MGLIEERWLSYRYTIVRDSLAQGGEGVVVKVDSDGNGIFGRTITSDSELTGDEFIRWTAGLGYLGFIKICQNTPQLCWGDEWPPSPLGGEG